MSSDYDYLLKILLVGDAAVGKSSLLLRFCDGNFNDAYNNTIGVDFKFRIVEIRGKRVKLQMWDTAGQERFRTLTSTFYRNAHGVLAVYDITRQSTFDQTNSWLAEVDRYAPESVTTMLVGNKADLEHNREVDYGKAAAHAQSRANPMSFFESSARTGQYVDDLFITLATLILPKVEAISRPVPRSVNIRAEEEEQRSKKSNCC